MQKYAGGNFGDGSHAHTWAPADCGGTLPGPDHHGVLVRMQHCGRDTNFRALNVGDPSGPGISFDLSASCSTYTFTALYLELP